MNKTGQPLKLEPNFKPLVILAVIGLVLFLIFQVFPSTSSRTLETGKTPEMISKPEAAKAAERFVREQMQMAPAPEETPPLVTYQSRSDVYGYLSKENKLDEYNKKYESKYPYDVYRVRFEEPDGTALNVDVHMQNGGIAGFSYDLEGSRYKGAMLQGEGVRREMLLIIEGDLSLAEKQALAEPWVQRAGYDSSRLELLTREGEPGLQYRDPAAKVGDAVLQLGFTFENGQLRSYEPAFSVPKTHSAYVEKQTLNATLLTILGYGLFTLVLGVLAIIYSVKTKAHTSFKRGIFLASLLFVIQMLNTYNLIPFFKAEGMSASGISGIMIFYAGYSLIFSALLYFSLVGGNGLWRKENGLNPWPQAKDPGYGPYVLQSMKVGYVWALILLGVQSIIFVGLSLTLHTWSTTDASQSPYNMLYPWLFPLMAWFAGISEEAVYRLFGIKMVKKIVRNTFAASLITSIIWALGHTLYPIYPVISRPIELVIIGLLFSFVFLRYGYLSAVFAHVVFNSILMGFSLMMMNDTANLLFGIFYIILPAIVGYAIYKFNPGPPTKETAYPSI
ncbi:CPBP family intramembrane glutamic endopeptidase [Paenibacillus sp. DMB20]|uniref:CPBP family intramembrane glutamic endopeptidase n=1 Tax=Paenibacillus sp. DMB20 TaxID=1642570 RepID=UPI0006281B7D|nr:CPBP family intramembrane glutamic endopeptidase [Paenibacillus sp. DMB20]KKO50938.1 abortive phage infection protein [Paenibacillus sp. DMB20]